MVRRLLDVNVIMALLWEDHDHHERALKWFRTLSSFATCPLSQLGFVRISSNAKIGYGNIPEEAFVLLRKFLGDDRHQFIPDDLSCDARSLMSENIRTFQSVTDHYLVALARQHKLTLATFDEPLCKAFAHEPGLVELIP